MILQAELVCAALLSDSAVQSIIGDKLFRDMPPSEATFPCVTYAESNSPALGADNAEALTAVVFALECWHRQSAWPLASAVDRVLASLGYVRAYAQDGGIVVGDLHQVSMKFSAIKEG